MRASGGTAAPAPSDSSARRAIGWIAALFLVKTAVLALFVTPLWDVPDEVGHYALVADIADGRGLPLPGRSVIPPDVIADWATKKTLSPEEKLNWVAQHPPLFHLLAVPFLEAARFATHDSHWIYRAPRLLSALSGAAALLVFFALLLEASGDPFLSLTAAASVGFVPMFSHMASGTNHDVFLALLCAVATLYWVRLSRTGQFSDASKMAVALALAGAVKFSALVVAGALVLLSIPFLEARRGARVL
ncbi:MAG TPA: glycosyltransferase family 39 protein, partial [Thermoanaerobaculia bacterium]